MEQPLLDANPRDVTFMRFPCQVLQAALVDCAFLDILPFSQNSFVSPEVDISGSDVVQALMVALVVVILHEGADLALQVARKIVVFQ